MISKTQSTDASVLDELVDKICVMLQSGKQVDIDQLALQHPEMAPQLRKLYPTLLAINTLDATMSPIGSPIADDKHHATQTLGDFQILRQIGRGGMGIVYEAEQLTINRKVALKILPLAALVDPRALQRFKNEVAAIATLQHAHIVAVYSIGEERGIHYYAMQLIRGQSLAAVIRELRARSDQDQRLSGDAFHQAVSDIGKQEEEKEEEKGSSEKTGSGLFGAQEEKGSSEKTGSGLFGAQHPQGRSGQRDLTPFSNGPDELSETLAVETQARGRSSTVRSVGDATYFRNVARLIQQAAEALQHAHDHGIVHRDVKPGNLLLDAHGTLVVTDFGLARIETGAGVTMTGDILGTLRYMSPEQVLANRMVIDHRTDVYSLGATLYELLTLQPMLTGENKAELIRQISFEEPVRPQKFNSAIPLDLETIVLKAISKNPADRYNSSQALADDLQCLLDHKPIAARRPTMVQRINKWSHRHPTILWSASIFMLMVTIGSVVSATLIYSANNRTRQALTQSQKNFNESRRQADRAEQNLDRALEAVENLLWRVGESQLEDVPGTEQLRQELLSDAKNICNSLIDSGNKDPRVQLRNIEARASLGTIQSQLGEDELAGQTLKLAILEFEKWLAENPNHAAADQARQAMAGAYVNLGGHYVELAQYERASEMYDLGLALERKLSTGKIQDSNPQNRFLRALAYGNYSFALAGLNKDHAARDACQHAISILEQLINDEPKNAMYRVYLGWAHSQLASSHNNLSQWDDATNNFDRAVSILRKWSDQSSNKAWSKSILGGTAKKYALLLADMDRDKAKALLEESQSVFTELHRQFPDFPDYQSSLADCYLHLAGLNRVLGKYPESIEILEKSISLRRDLAQQFPDRPDYPSELAKTLMDYSGMLDLVNQKRQSDAARAEGIQIVEKLVEDNPQVPDYRFFLVMGHYNIAMDRDRQGQPAEAVNVFEKAASICEGLVEEFPDVLRYQAQLSDIYSSRGNCLLTLDKFEDALEQNEKSMALVRRLLDRDPSNPSYQEKLLNSQFNLAATQCNLGQFENALQTFQDAIPEYKKRIKLDPKNPFNKFNYANCLANVAYTYRETDQFELTAEYLEQALGVVNELHVSYPNPFVRQAIAEYTEDLLEAYSKIDEQEKLMALLGSAQEHVDQFLDELNSNELLFKKLIEVSSLCGKLGAREQSEILLKKCQQTGKREFGNEHELTLKAANRLGLAQLNAMDWKFAQETFEQIIDIRTNIHREQTENDVNTLMLGGAYCNLGNAQSELSLDAIENYTAAIELLESLNKKLDFRNQFLKNSCQGRAEAYRRAELFAESLADFDRALDLAEDGPSKSELQLRRLKTRAKQGDYAQAVKLADAIVTELENDNMAYHAAGVFAIAAPMALKDITRTAEQQQLRFETYCDRAFELLEITKQTKRFGNEKLVNAFLKDPDFSAIQADERFRQFVNAVKSAATEK